MVRQVLVAPVVLGKCLLEFEGEEMEDNQENVILRVLAIMGEWVLVGQARDVPEKDPNTAREVDLAFRAGWEGELVE